MYKIIKELNYDSSRKRTIYFISEKCLFRWKDITKKISHMSVRLEFNSYDEAEEFLLHSILNAGVTRIDGNVYRHTNFVYYM